MSTSWNIDSWPTEKFLQEYANAVDDGTAALFCGAGVSIPAGMVNWYTLLKPIAEDLGLEINRVTDLLSLAQFAHNRHGRQHLNEAIVNEFVKASKPSTLQELIVRLPVDMVWTSNYDQTGMSQAL